MIRNEGGGGGAGVIPPVCRAGLWARADIRGRGGGGGVRAETGKPSPSPLMVYTCASQRINAPSRKTYLGGTIGWGGGFPSSTTTLTAPKSDSTNQIR